MAQPLVIAYHLVWTVYGAWLPNDPRGSGSKTVRSDVIAELGALHFGRKKVQPARSAIRAFHESAADALKHPLLTLDTAATAFVAQSFASTVQKHHYTCYACAVMPDHVHILIRKHKHSAEEMADNLKEASRQELIQAQKRAPTHPAWLRGHGWKVYLDHPEEIRRTIRYIEQNPVKIGQPVQHWNFVKAYDGWPLHPGHNPNSPYVQRLRAAGRYP